MARGPRCSPQLLPPLGAIPIDSDRVGTERDAGARRLHDGAVPPDREGRRHVAHGALCFEPVREPRGAWHPEREQRARNADDDDELEQCEPLGHPLFIACRGNPAVS